MSKGHQQHTNEVLNGSKNDKDFKHHRIVMDTTMGISVPLFTDGLRAMFASGNVLLRFSLIK